MQEFYKEKKALCQQPFPNGYDLKAYKLMYYTLPTPTWRDICRFGNEGRPRHPQ